MRSALLLGCVVWVGCTAGAPPELKYVFEIPAAPLKVSVTLDDARANQQVLTPAGGEIAVTGADGTVFTLAVPAGALVTDTRITMTPAVVTGMPFGEGPLAVHFAPEGLQFYAPTWLQVKPATAIPLNEQILFGYSGMGDDLVLAGTDVNNSDISIRVAHFSGYGVTRGFLASTEAVRERLGGATEARIDNAIGEFLQRERQVIAEGGEPGSTAGLDGLMQEYVNKVVKPRLQAAGEGCAGAKLALQSAMTVERNRALLGFEAAFDWSELGPAIVAGGDACMREEHQVCVEQHVIHRILPGWLSLLRQLQLLGLASEGTTPPGLAAAEGLVKKCLKFEALFHSEALFDGGGGDGYTSVVESTVKLDYQGGATITGAAPLINRAWEFRVAGCNVISNRGGTTFEVQSLSWLGAFEPPKVQDLRLHHSTGSTTETATIACPMQPPTTLTTGGYWSQVYADLHDAERDITYLAQGWEIFGDEYYARKEWTRSDAASGTTETGSFKLYHRPAP